MNALANTILQRVLDRYAGGGGFMSRGAAAGILRLALRWPAFTVIMILSVVAARALSARPAPAGRRPSRSAGSVITA
jgi:hypothetical protein